MKLTVAIALNLTELGAGVLLLLPLVPISEVRRSFFTFHSMLAAIAFALAGGLHLVELHSPLIAAGLGAAMLVSVASFGTVVAEKFAVTRLLHLLAALLGIAFGLIGSIYTLASRMGAAQGAGIVTASLIGVWMISALMGAALLGNTHNAMTLGHWYLISRNLSFGYLIRITKVLMAVIGIRALLLIVFLLLLPQIAPLYTQQYLQQLWSANGNLMFFLMRVAWGLVLPLILAFMAWRCAVGKANQAATGLLYLCEVSVLFGELFAAYLMV
jgi:hypothetical protein